jgi:tetratricopeptide (TPR) repeat protein
VYGTKANSASPLKGFQLARKVKSAFESAEALDPHNADAANDLAEYYISAPAIVGGGLDKAAALADRIAATLPQSAHRTRALIAEKRGDMGTAEREFQAAAERNAPAAWVDLGNFYARRNRPDEAVKALRHAVELDHAHDASLVDAATILASLHRETPLAEHALRAYLASDAQSDAAPAFAVYVSLGHLLESGGDPAAAREAYQQSLQLAHGYAPAMHALHGQEG